MNRVTIQTILLFILLHLYHAQILKPSCNICLRCTYCGSDVLYDCDVDGIYSSLLKKYPTISSAYPIRITKTVNNLITSYFFQFSNNLNITYQIKPKSTTLPNKSIDTKPVNVSKTEEKPMSNSTTAVPSTPQLWQGIANASQIVLNYVISNFYLNARSLRMVSINKSTPINTYEALVQSSESNLKLIVNINPIDFKVVVLNISYIAQATTPQKDIASAQPQSIIKVAGGVKLNPNIEGLLKFLLTQYSLLQDFILDSYSTSDNSVYSLNLTNIKLPNIKYIFQVISLTPVSSNLRGTVQKTTYQIMDYTLVRPASTDTFINLDSAKLLYSDGYAQTVISQVNSQIVKPLNPSKSTLLNISSSTPFYTLYYSINNKIYYFYVSYDVLSKKIRLIQEKAITPNITTDKNVKANVITFNKTSSVKQQLKTTQVNITDNSKNKIQTIPISSNPISSPNSSSHPSIVKPSPFLLNPQPSMPPKISQGPSLTYINYRSDPLFSQVSTIINANYQLNSSRIIKVAQQKTESSIEYIITLNFNLESTQYLQFVATYNPTFKNVSFSKFVYTPPIALTPSIFKQYPLNTIGSNQVIMKIIAFIFMQYPQYFTTSVSEVIGISTYPPYYNITYNNSAFGILIFDTVFNYFTNNIIILNYTITKQATQSSSNTKKPVEDTEAMTKMAKMMQITNTSSTNTNEGDDIFCVKYSKGICVECTFRFYYDKSRSKCVSVQDWCYQFDYLNNLCTECFSGYSLKDNYCYESL